MEHKTALLLRLRGLMQERKTLRRELSALSGVAPPRQNSFSALELINRHKPHKHIHRAISVTTLLHTIGFSTDNLNHPHRLH